MFNTETQESFIIANYEFKPPPGLQNALNCTNFFYSCANRTNYTQEKANFFKTNIRQLI